MTLNGAIKQLHDIRNSDAMPVYFKPAIAEVINVLLSDVRENVKGQWLDYYDNPIKFYFDGRYSAHCSVCGYHPEYEEEMRNANFCPCCGAEKQKEEQK